MYQNSIILDNLTGQILNRMYKPIWLCTVQYPPKNTSITAIRYYKTSQKCVII